MSEKSERIFIIGLDGAIGWAVQKANTPNIDKALARGAITYNATTVFPSASFEAWGAMFHGVALGLPAPSSWDARIPKELFCF